MEADLTASSPPVDFMFIHADSEAQIVDAVESGLQTTVVPVMFRRGGTEVTTEGSAFCVSHLANGEAIFVTARHVIECLGGAHDLAAFIVLPRGTENNEARRDLQGIPVQQISLSDTFSDVALMMVNTENAATAGLRLDNDGFESSNGGS
jgi:hypothetical protein